MNALENGLHTRVLLVDDEEEFLSILAQRLEARDLNVSKATRGEDAVQIVDEKDFDVIILDLSMPGMDGLETLKEIKKRHPDAEIIMLTGHGTVQAGVEAMKLGAEDFVEKPVDIKDLMEKIQDAREKRVIVLQKRSKEEIEKILKSKSW